MENLFKELAWKAYQNGLGFEKITNGGLYVWDHNESEAIIVSNGYLNREGSIELLERMHQEVDEYIGRETADDMENVYFEQPRGVTADELKMKEAGHKISDF